jgi:NAD(P)-dependent dehydrogenase (short-subunit alcohol dehydrogenase family)
VVVVTGGGGGIGAAIAEELGRDGWFVVTVDPLVSLDGSEQLAAPEETTADRIVAAGGAARASGASVTDGPAVRSLFEGLVDEFGHLDAVINVAGISRPTSFTRGSEDDWRGVLSVHLDGYLNVLSAALPIMAAAGHGRILGVTSGSGWREADAGAYGCAKRAVASLTWQLGRHAPEGVVINAMSPIAVTRMVTAALEAAKAKAPSGGSASGGLSLGSMPTPEELGPFGAHLVSDAIDWCSGQVLFAGGSEVAIVSPPRLLEVVRTGEVSSPAHLLEAITAAALAPAEAAQATTGATNPRTGPSFDEPGDDDLPTPVARTCAVVSDRPDITAAVTAALEARGVTCTRLGPDEIGAGFADAAAAVSATGEGEPLDAVVVALAGGTPHEHGSAPRWQALLEEHDHLVERIHADAAWARSVADEARRADRPVRIVTLTDAVTSGGRSRAQAAAQLTRAARRATGDRVAAFAVSVESPSHGDVATVGELAAHLVCSPDAVGLSGAELVVGEGWLGLRSHPAPRGSITLGGAQPSPWLDDALRRIVGEEDT